MNDRQQLTTTRRLVIKVGSRLLAESPAGRPALLADQIAALRSQGIECVLVTSGAIALGVRALGYKERPRELPRLQAAAAAGQSRLMQHWEHAFLVHGIAIGQILVTHDDVSNRRRFLSARETLRALLEAGAVPVINENDTVATEEIKFGDNDQLAALVCNLVSADALIVLTDVDGLWDGRKQRIAIVRDVTKEASPMAGASRNDGIGSGGMASKVASAARVTRSGIPCVIANGRSPTVLLDVVRGADVGTLFVPSGKLDPRKHWIAYSGKPRGAVHVDAGAERAIKTGGRSLLPAGITRVVGPFAAGDTISVRGAKGEIARGLVSYDAGELAQIAGKASSAFANILGYRGANHAIHCDDLVLL